MALPFVTHTVYVIRPKWVRDAHGNLSRTTKAWGNAERMGPYPAVVQPDAAMMGSSLPTMEPRHLGPGREHVDSRVRVRLNPGVDVKATDAIEIPEGQSFAGVYELNGDPLGMHDPFGGMSHLDLKARKVRG